MLKEAQERVKKSNKKISAIKGAKRAAYSVISFAIVTALILFLNRVGLDISPEEKKELVNVLVQILVGGGLLSFGGFAFANANKDHKE